MMRKTNLALAMALLAGLSACGGSEPAVDEATGSVETGTEAAPTAASDAPPQQATAAADTSLKLDEIDAYVRGMQKEIELVKAAGEKVKQALTDSALRGWALGEPDYVAELQRRTARRVTPGQAGRPPAPSRPARPRPAPSAWSAPRRWR